MMRSEYLLSSINKPGTGIPVRTSYPVYKVPRSPLGSRASSFPITGESEVGREAAGQSQEAPWYLRIHADV
jgi:hypothetical protein